MSVLEKFIAFAEALPADRRREVESILAEIMDSDSPEFGFTPEEIAELDRRCADEPEELIDEDVVRARLRQLRG